MQSLQGAYDKLGGHDAGKGKCHRLLTNTVVKIFHKNNDTETCEYMSTICGKAKEVMGNQSTGHKVGDPLATSPGGWNVHSSAGGHESYEHEIKSWNWSKLRVLPEQGLCEAVVYGGGKPFANGKPWLVTFFRQF